MSEEQAPMETDNETGAPQIIGFTDVAVEAQTTTAELPDDTASQPINLKKDGLDVKKANQEQAVKKQDEPAQCRQM